LAGRDTPDTPCDGAVERQVTGGTGLIFKGSGFYITDYKNKPGDAKGEGDSAAAKPTGDGASESDSKADSEKKRDGAAASKGETASAKPVGESNAAKSESASVKSGSSAAPSSTPKPPNS
jgi:predicted nucleic acid-binding Zn ribbon protein